MKLPSITVAFVALSMNCIAEQAAGQEHAAPAATEPAALDLLRFTNDDTLHGSFLGFDDHFTMLWKNPEAPEAIRFSTKKIHRIVLNQGHGHQKMEPTSSLTLINGDVIPCTLVSADQQTITLTSRHLGTLTIPRDTVSKISPTPYGGNIFYYGPLSTKGWKTVAPPETNKDDTPKEDANKEDANKAIIKPQDKNQVTDWKHIANAWYSGTDKDRYLVLENSLPDKCRLSFKLAWRSSFQCNIAIHADFEPPAYEGKEDSSKAHYMAATVGRSYIVSLSRYSTYLYSCTFDEAGKPTNTRLETSRINLGLPDKDEAQFEFRIDRANKQLLFYLNGQFTTNWDLGEEYHGKGNSLAFRNAHPNNNTNSTLRVSDIIISQWNGLKDSAQSMHTKERDVILFTNGVDRFSGTFNSLNNDKISFLGSYDNPFTIPIEEVQEVYFASKKLRKTDQKTDDDSVYFYVPPYGRISGIPGKGANAQTKLISNLLGEVTLDTNYVNIIDFSHQNSLLDLWDDNF